MTAIRNRPMALIPQNQRSMGDGHIGPATGDGQRGAHHESDARPEGLPTASVNVRGRIGISFQRDT